MSGQVRLVRAQREAGCGPECFCFVSAILSITGHQSPEALLVFVSHSLLTELFLSLFV